jgi:hypothetical protein
MSVAGVGPNISTPLPQPKAAAATPKPALAPDGDPPAVEAAETAATKAAEVRGGGKTQVNIVA